MRRRAPEMNEPGTLSLGEKDTLHLTVEGEHYLIDGKDVRNLLFYGRVVPIIQINNKEDDQNVTIEGHASVNRPGKAITFFTRSGHFIIPMVSVQRVARGEAVSAPIFPLLPGDQEGEQ
jgi:hypothetical protein